MQGIRNCRSQQVWPIYKVIGKIKIVKSRFENWKVIVWCETERENCKSYKRECCECWEEQPLFRW